MWGVRYGNYGPRARDNLDDDNANYVRIKWFFRLAPAWTVRLMKASTGWANIG